MVFVYVYVYVCDCFGHGCVKVDFVSGSCRYCDLGTLGRLGLVPLRNTSGGVCAGDCLIAV